MIEIKTCGSAIGLVLVISAALSAATLLIEWLFKQPLFKVFFAVMPRMLRLFFPSEPMFLWFEARSNAGLYNSWDVMCLFLLILPIAFLLLMGFWIVLILKLLAVVAINNAWIVAWFAVLVMYNFFIAVQQTGLEIGHRHKERDAARIKQYIKDHPKYSLKRVSYHFFQNFIRTPITGLKLIFTVFLFTWLHWPGWIISIFVQKGKLDLEVPTIRKYYYQGYTLVCVVSGSILMFVFG